MKYEEFVAQVQDRADLDSPDVARRAIAAALETLGERLLAEDAHRLAEELPPELGRYVEDAETGQQFDVDDFFTRVSYREGTDISLATDHARIVLGLLRRAVSPGVMSRIHARLEKQYDSLFRGIGKGHRPGGRR